MIRAVVKTACQEYACDIVGIEDGYDGLVMPGKTRPLTPDAVRGLLSRGGTVLGTANRGNPIARKALRGGQEVIEDISHEVQAGFQRLGLDGLIVVGGDGTLRIAHELGQRFGLPIVGVPKTIDNDFRRVFGQFRHICGNCDGWYQGGAARGGAAADRVLRVLRQAVGR